MPHFSIGFVAVSSPRRPVVSECGLWRDRVEVECVWPREGDKLCGSCCEHDACIKPGTICAPKGDDALVIFSVYDTDGDEFDLTGAQEIVLLVADTFGGEVRFIKRLTDGDIQISTNMYQLSAMIDAEDTDSLVNVYNYYEIQVTNSAGLKRTISRGVFEAPNTMIRDL